MNRIAQLDPAVAVAKSKELFDLAQSKLGGVPNLIRVLANSPAALEGFLSLNAALAQGVLSAKVRAQIALAVAEINDCAYCQSANAYSANALGLTKSDINDARKITARDERTAAILDLARNIIVERGRLSESEFSQIRNAKLTDAEIIETAVNVVLNILTNYVNNLARTLVDFPAVASMADEFTVGDQLKVFGESAHEDDSY